jgi:hypothetical protein
MSFKIIILHLLKAVGVFAFFRKWTRGVPRILCYHGGSRGDEHLFNPKLFCPPGMLESRLKWLQKNGFVPASLNDLVEPHTSQSLHGTPIIITLDDDWHSSFTDLLPVLARHGHQPTLYLATKVFIAGVPVLDVCLRYMLWKSSLETVTLRDVSSALDGTYQLG